MMKKYAFGIDIGGISHELSAHSVKLLNVTEADIETYYLSIPDIQKSIIDLQSI